MPEYQCGHNSKPVFMKRNTADYAIYLLWKNSVGYNGTKEQCFKCFNKDREKMR